MDTIREDMRRYAREPDDVENADFVRTPVKRVTLMDYDGKQTSNSNVSATLCQQNGPHLGAEEAIGTGG